MAALCPDANLETHHLQGDLCRCFHEGSLQAAQVVVTLSASHVLQNSPQLIVQGVQVWTPRGPILGADKGRNVPPQPLLSRLGLMGRSWVLLEDSFLTVLLKGFTTPCSILLIHSGTSFHAFLTKLKKCHPLMGHPPPNHNVGRVLASCTLRTHLKGPLSINLVVLVVILLPDGENFLVREEDVFVPVLGVPMEETLCSCPSNFLQSRSNEVSLWAEVRSHM